MPIPVPQMRTPAIELAGGDTAGDGERIVGIIDRISRSGAEVAMSDAERIEQAGDFLLECDTRMIGAEGHAHGGDPTTQRFYWRVKVSSMSGLQPTNPAHGNGYDLEVGQYHRLDEPVATMVWRP